MGNCMCKNVIDIDENITDMRLVSRCGETAEISEIFKSKSLKPSRPYYSNELMEKRMTEIRSSIMYIRENWEKYNEFLNDLKDLTKDVHFQNENVQGMFDSMFLCRKEWGMCPSGSDLGQFDTIKLYSTEEGYDNVFSMINRIFRADEAVDYTKLIRSMVFLVELLNIELFNFCLKEPNVHNFKGVVYRGMALPVDDFNAFEDLLSRPIADRNIAVPLGFMSASTNIKVGISFIKSHETDDTHPLIQKIHVLELKPEYLRLYRTRFPSSVVSTICAVDIKNLSYFKNESEILLRGPFFQVLRIYKSKIQYGLKKTLRILEMVMLNTNRDHISTMQLGKQSDPARTLFGTMVAITRSEFAAEFCKNHKILDDSKQYQEVADNKKALLEDLTPRKYDEMVQLNA